MDKVRVPEGYNWSSFGCKTLNKHCVSPQSQSRFQCQSSSSFFFFFFCLLMPSPIHVLSVSFFSPYLLHHCTFSHLAFIISFKHASTVMMPQLMLSSLLVAASWWNVSVGILIMGWGGFYWKWKCRWSTRTAHFLFYLITVFCFLPSLFFRPILICVLPPLPLLPPH